MATAPDDRRTVGPVNSHKQSPVTYSTAVLQVLLIASSTPADIASRISTATGLPTARVYSALSDLVAAGLAALGDYTTPSVRAYELTPEGRRIAERDRQILLGLARMSVATVGVIPRQHAPSRKVVCPVCNNAQWLTQRGTLSQHRGVDGSVCAGSYSSPDDTLTFEALRLRTQNMTQKAIGAALGLTQREVSACLIRAGARAYQRGPHTRASSSRNLALRLLADGPCDLAELNKRIEVDTGRRRSTSALYAAVQKLIGDGLVAHVDTLPTRSHVLALVTGAA